MINADTANMFAKVIGEKVQKLNDEEMFSRFYNYVYTIINRSAKMGLFEAYIDTTSVRKEIVEKMVELLDECNYCIKVYQVSNLADYIQVYWYEA